MRPRSPRSATWPTCCARMGAVVRGAGTSRLVIEGVEHLHPTNHTVVPDRVVAATYVAAVGIAGGEVIVADARPDHMEMLLRKVAQMGVRDRNGTAGFDGERHRADRCRPTSPPCPTRGWRPTTSPLLVAMLSVADGVGILTENLFFGPIPLRRRASPHGSRHPHRRPPRGGARGRPPLGCSGACPRPPRRGGPGAGRIGRRRRDRGERSSITSGVATRTWLDRWLTRCQGARVNEPNVTRPRRAARRGPRP